MSVSWSMRTRLLAPLKVGDSVFIQNQEGNYPRRWDKRGQVVEVKGYDQYIVRVDGSRRLTRRNRKFLRKFEQYRPDGMNAPQTQTPQEGLSVKRSSHLHFPLTSENVSRCAIPPFILCLLPSLLLTATTSQSSLLSSGLCNFCHSCHQLMW